MQLRPEDAAKLAGDFLDLDAPEKTDPPSGLVGVPVEGVLPGRLAGERLGRYRIARLVGSGGMGEVYEAEQDSPRRRVALKVVRAHLMSADLRRRFEHEVRILGSLQHPGIAQIYEAGQLGDQEAGGGTPFFAMEFVEGEPLTQYAGARKLGVRERLELFLRVCQAVEHAHQRGVIHRDLKPANILVATETDSQIGTAGGSSGAGSGETDLIGQPKVLDFGVARATDADVAATSVHTEVGKLVGTLPYMSPEQASGDPRDLDTRSDVYALGVVLYELLSGKLPYEMTGDGGARVAQALRVIKEVDPTPLSSIDRMFRGDLETIVGKALEKERERRYQSVGELAGDIRRYLADEPIVARKAGTWYELKKFGRRNRIAVVAMTIVLFTLAAGAGVATAFAFRESRARRAESAERVTQESVTRFLQLLLESAHPEQQGREARVVDILEEASRRLDSGGAATPAVERALRRSIGRARLALNELEAARPDMERTYELSLALYGPTDPRTLEDEHDLCLLAVKQGRHEQSLPALRDILQRHQELLGESAAGTLAASITLASTLGTCGRPMEALEIAEKYHRVSSEAWGPDNILAIKLGLEVGKQLTALDRYEDAAKVLEDCIERFDGIAGTREGLGLEAANTLATVYRRLGRVDDAIRLYESKLDAMLEFYGPRHIGTLTWRMNLAQAIGRRDGPERGEPLTRTLLDDALQALGPTNDLTLGIRYNLTGQLLKMGRIDEVAELLKQNVEDGEASLPPGSTDLAVYRRDYGATLMRLDRPREAEPLLVQAYEAFQSSVGPRHALTVRTVEFLAIVYEKLDDQERADFYKTLAAESKGASKGP